MQQAHFQSIQFKIQDFPKFVLQS